MTRLTAPLQVCGTDDDGTNRDDVGYVLIRKAVVMQGAIPTTANVLTPIASANFYIPNGASIIRAGFRNLNVTGSAASFNVLLGTTTDSNEYGTVGISAMGDYAISLSARSAVSANSPLVMTMLVPTTAQVSALGATTVSGIGFIEYLKG